uniref:SCP domain-containing protein n=1 Tax=Ascaris lumbricoides TaxID=6252 RepID=A0A0M3IGS2_ASCLU
MHCADRNPKSMNYSDKEYAERLETTSYGATRYAQNDGSPSIVTNLRNYGLPGVHAGNAFEDGRWAMTL